MLFVPGISFMQKHIGMLAISMAMKRNDLHLFQRGARLVGGSGSRRKLCLCTHTDDFLPFLFGPFHYASILLLLLSELLRHRQLIQVKMMNLFL